MLRQPTGALMINTGAKILRERQVLRYFQARQDGKAEQSAKEYAEMSLRAAAACRCTGMVKWHQPRARLREGAV